MSTKPKTTAEDIAKQEAEKLAELRSISEAEQAAAAVAVAEQAAKQAADAAEAAAVAKSAPTANTTVPAKPAAAPVDPNTVPVPAIVRAVPNSGFISLNGIRVTLPKQGDKVKVPRIFCMAFPQYLAALD